MINKKLFYDSIRASLFAGKLTESQVSGIESILQGFDKWKICDLRWQAYMLATVFHETAKTMQPIEEYGKGKGRPYGKKIKQDGTPYKFPDKIYYGRSLVQITHYENYERMGKILSLPLLEQPELALIPGIAVDILIEGMTKGKSNFGDFTGKSLENYFNNEKTDWVNARKIINSLDRAQDIAEYAKKFYTALTAV